MQRKTEDRRCERHATSYVQELIRRLDSRTLRPVTVLGLLVFSFNNVHKERY